MTSQSEGRDGIMYMGWLTGYTVWKSNKGVGLAFSGSYYSYGTGNDIVAL